MKSIHDPRYEIVIQALVAARIEHGITQTQLAIKLNRPQSFVAKVEGFDRRLDLVELKDWLTALEISARTFANQFDWW